MKLNKQIFGWMMYDFANSAFTTIIVSVVYSVYFIQQVVGGDSGYGEMLWGRAIGISMTLVALSAPIMGAVADYSRSKKKFLFINSYLVIIFTALLYFVKPGQIMMGMVFFIVANYGFNTANVFYDSFLPEITSVENIGKVSGYGWALGYVGGLLSLLISLLLLKHNVRWIFPMIALHFLIFSLFTFVWLKEIQRPSKRTNYLKVAYTRISTSLKNMRSYPQLLKFIISYFIYNDAITTVIVFASIYGHDRFGMDTQAMLIYFILAQFTSIIGSMLFGWLTDKKGVKLSLSGALSIWLVVVLWAFFCRSATEYYFVGLAAGLAIGSSQANSRTMLSLLTPRAHEAEFFGFYALTGRLSAIIGPILYGWIAHKSGDIRYSILTLIIFFAAGLIVLQSVDPQKGNEDAAKPITT